MMTFPIYYGKIKHVPNHQSAIFAAEIPHFSKPFPNGLPSDAPVGASLRSPHFYTRAWAKNQARLWVKMGYLNHLANTENIGKYTKI
jgi:hypothetical protein